MLEIQNEADIRNEQNQESRLLFLPLRKKIPLDLGRIVTEIITGGRFKIMQKLLEKALVTSEEQG